jgi:protein O-mannosyl-transferase
MAGRPALQHPVARFREPAPLVLALALVLVVMAAYALTVGGEFLWDDDLHVAANPTIIGPLGLHEIWTTSRANYFPLVLTNFWIQHALWGLNPAGYHIVTVCFHAVAALLLWRVLNQLRVPGAWLGAALWALHPVQVESVAWISELKNTQSAVFFLLAILLWLRWLEWQPLPAAEAKSSAAGSRSHYVLSLLCTVLALLSKPSTVMLPVALVLCTWWQCGRLTRRHLLAVAPFFIPAAVASGWTIWEQKFHSGAIGPEWSQTWAERAVIAGRVIWFYLGKLAWPQPLSFIYERWAINARSILQWVPLLSAVGLLGWLWLARASRARALLFAAAYFVALLFPVLGFFDVYFFRYSFVGDHFQYLASMAPLALLGAGLTLLPRRIFWPAGVTLLAGLAALTRDQTTMYQNNTALWQATVARNPRAVMAWLNLGDVLSWNHRYAESIAAYREALRLRPDDADGHNDLGNVLTLAGDPDAGVVELQRAVALRPDSAVMHNGLGVALRAAGRREEAIAQYTEAIRLQPDYGGAHNNLGVEFAEAGRPGEAIPHFEAALRAKPDAVKARESLVRALHRHGMELIEAHEWAEAVDTFQRAVQLVPDSAPFREALAVALAKSERFAEAVPVLEAAIKLQPDAAELHDNLGQVLLGLGRKREALEELEKAAQLRRSPPR